MAAPKYKLRLGWRSLKAVCPSLTRAQAKALAVDLAYAMRAHDITTRDRAAMFIAQIAHESGEFRWREEIASGAAYEGRRDLGNAYQGDGRRFKGRGYLQITGRSNYAQASKALGRDFVKSPSRLAQSPWASRAAAWWWQAHGCPGLSDGGGERALLAVTRRVNGGTMGLSNRRKYYRRARRVSRFLVPKRRRP